MTIDRANDDRDDETFDPDIDRRTFIAAGGTVGATMLAGCAGDTTSDDSSDAPDEEETDGSTTVDGANFRLLISDRPADIGDFDRLDVSFDSARIFDGGGEESSDGEESGAGEDTESETDGEDAEADDEETTTDGDEEEPSDDSDDDSDANDDSDSSDGTVERRRGFYWLDLEGATVDLTQVVGEKAVSVFEGGLSAGTYEKIELHVADVEGVVDGETVPVKVPSEKLQIKHSFEVREDEPLEFVFDINVVEKGNGGYNLQPVISESGVAGTDVDVEEVDGESGDDRDEDADERGDASGNEGDTGGSDGNETNDGDADDGTESEANP